jgi:hypothetical protein
MVGRCGRTADSPAVLPGKVNWCGVRLIGAGSRDGVNGTGGGSGSSDGVSSIGGKPCSRTAVSCSFERLLYLV